MAPALAQSVDSRVIAPGVRHTVLHHAEGPWAVHLLDVDLRACGVDLRGAKAGGRVIGRETTSAMARTAETSLSRPVLAAVNADFFTFDPPGRPETIQIIDGVVVKSVARLRVSPDSSRRVAQPVFALDSGERPLIFAPSFNGSIGVRGSWFPLAAVNAPDSTGGLVLYNRYFDVTTPLDTGAVEVVLRPLDRSATGDTARAIVQSIDHAPGGVPLEEQAVVLAGRGAAADPLRALLPGDTVHWRLGFGPDSQLIEAIGGLPPMLQDARDVYLGTYWMPASFVEQRHPRTAIGWAEPDHITLLVVDGRQPGYSDGMTLPELAAYLRGLGLRDALNFDGGGSTTLVVGDTVQNKPSDAEGERAVANALLVLGPAAGTCGT